MFGEKEMHNMYENSVSIEKKYYAPVLHTLSVLWHFLESLLFTDPSFRTNIV